MFLRTRYRPRYNQVLDVTDITDESDVITEPVTLQEMKDFLRLEGFSTDSTNVVSEAPISITLLEGETSAQNALLIDATILTLAREGTIYTKSNTVGNRRFTHDATTGTVTFLNQGTAGGETLDITYGYAGSASGDDAFDFDNDLIEELITSAREGIERYTGMSLVPHRWKVLLTNGCGDIELPYSNGILTNESGVILDSILDSDGELVEEYTLIGTGFLTLNEPCYERMTITYSVEPTVPKRLKQAIMRDVAFHYENRADQAGKISEQAMVLASSYRRPSTIIQ